MKEKIVYNIGLGSPEWIEDILSNLKYKLFFVFGQTFFSVEGPLQAIKYDLSDVRRLVAQGLSGIPAKQIGKCAEKQYVWLYDGKRYGYRSPEHMAFIEILIREKIYQNEDVFLALLLTGDSDIIHEIGHPEKPTTSLRKEEFTGILMKVREELKEICTEYLKIAECKAGEDSQKLENIRLEQAKRARRKYLFDILVR